MPAGRSRRSATARRTAVVVEANLFARIVRVVKSYANQIGGCGARELEAFGCMHAHRIVWHAQPPPLARPAPVAVSSAEDPEKILDQVVTEMQEDLIKMRQASAQVTSGRGGRALHACTCTDPSMQGAM